MPRIVAAFALLASAPLAVAQDPAAVVSRYLPAAAEHSVQRADGSTAVVALGMPLFAGEVVVVQAGGSVVLAYADGKSAEVNGGASFTVPEHEPLGFAAQVYGRLQSVLGRQYRRGENLATRGDGKCDDDTAPAQLAAPAIAAESYLGPGHTDLSLAWVGGCAPYTLSLQDANGRGYGAERLGRPQTRLDTPDLRAGEYTLVVSDARGERLSARILVRDTLPRGPFATVAEPAELDAVAYAAWLANHEEGRWRWESFQVLRPWIRNGSTLAGTYGDLVMWGDPRLSAVDD